MSLDFQSVQDYYAGDCAQCAEDVYRGVRTPHVCDPDYIRETTTDMPCGRHPFATHPHRSFVNPNGSVTWVCCADTA